VPLFVGEFEQTIDPKNRLSISSALREGIDPKEDGQRFYLVLGNDRHLWLYPDKYYARLIATMKRSRLPVKQAQGIAMLFGTARVVKPDAQGRVVLPARSMQRGIVSENVTLVGQGDHIEIWPTQEWNGLVESALPTYGQMLLEAAERLSEEERHNGSAT
jgi:MraZ protein